MSVKTFAIIIRKPAALFYSFISLPSPHLLLSLVTVNNWLDNNNDEHWDPEKKWRQKAALSMLDQPPFGNQRETSLLHLLVLLLLCRQQVLLGNFSFAPNTFFNFSNTNVWICAAWVHVPMLLPEGHCQPNAIKFQYAVGSSSSREDGEGRGGSQVNALAFF